MLSILLLFFTDTFVVIILNPIFTVVSVTTKLSNCVKGCMTRLVTKKQEVG